MDLTVSRAIVTNPDRTVKAGLFFAGFFDAYFARKRLGSEYRG